MGDGRNVAQADRRLEMADDVIFAGTATRPRATSPEVSDARQRQPDRPGRVQQSGRIGRGPQIERGGGSDYRINGRPVRQRDVQLLFADQATAIPQASSGRGKSTRSSAPGRRTVAKSSKKPPARRFAGRRHEAELKLKAAEQNLTRVDDVLHTLDAQLRSLKQQVRQASRYRNLAEHIRRTEAALLHLRWLEAEDKPRKRAKRSRPPNGA